MFIMGLEWDMKVSFYYNINNTGTCYFPVSQQHILKDTKMKRRFWSGNEIYLVTLYMKTSSLHTCFRLESLTQKSDKNIKNRGWS